MTTSIRRLPRPVRKLIATIAVLVAAALALGLSWLTHRPTGYSGNARVSSFISPDFASGFDVAWEATASDLGITGQIAATTTIDGVLIALALPEQADEPSQPTNKKTATSTAELVGIDASGKTPTVLWHHDLTKISGKLSCGRTPSSSAIRRSAPPTVPSLLRGKSPFRRNYDPAISHPVLNLAFSLEILTLSDRTVPSSG